MGMLELNKLRLNPCQLERELGTSRLVLYQPDQELGMAKWAFANLTMSLAS